MNRSCSGGHTFVELMVTMVVASLAVAFIGAAYVFCIRGWAGSRDTREAIEQARVLHARVDAMLSGASGLVQEGLGRWLVLEADGDTARLMWRGDSLLVDHASIHMAGRVPVFELKGLPGYAGARAWACGFTYVSHSGKQCSLAWRGVCAVGRAGGRTIPRPADSFQPRGLHWDR